MGQSQRSIESELVRDDSGRIIGAIWTHTCAWCGWSERIDMTKNWPVSDDRHGISVLCGWEIGGRLVICPECVQTDEQLRW